MSTGALLRAKRTNMYGDALVRRGGVVSGRELLVHFRCAVGESR